LAGLVGLDFPIQLLEQVYFMLEAAVAVVGQMLLLLEEAVVLVACMSLLLCFWNLVRYQ
jgi:hypothetical protein